MENKKWYAYMDEFGIWRATNNSWIIPNNTRTRNSFQSEEDAEDWIAKEKRNGINSTLGSSNKVT